MSEFSKPLEFIRVECNPTSPSFVILMYGWPKSRYQNSTTTCDILMIKIVRFWLLEMRLLRCKCHYSVPSVGGECADRLPAGHVIQSCLYVKTFNYK